MPMLQSLNKFGKEIKLIKNYDNFKQNKIDYEKKVFNASTKITQEKLKAEV